MSLNNPVQALAFALRKYRKASGLTGTQLADKLGWSQSRVSRIETASQTPSEYEVKEICEALDLSKDVQDQLIHLVHEIGVEFMKARVWDLKGVLHRQDEVRSIEAASSSIKTFSVTCIPSLLQTPDYTKALCSADFETKTWQPQDIESAIALRQERKEILNDKNRSFSFLLFEAALWVRYGSTSAMKSQLEALLNITYDRRFRFGIIPRGAFVGVIPFGSFKVYDQNLVVVEVITGEFNLTDPVDVERYIQSFEILSSAAVMGKRAEMVIREALSELL